MEIENLGPSLTSEGCIHPIGRTTFPRVDYFSTLLDVEPQQVVRCEPETAEGWP